MMIKYGIAFMLMALSALSFQHFKSGVIHYDLRIDMHRNIPSEREEMKKMIPQFRNEHYELYFDQTESLYKPTEEDDELEMSSGGMRISMKMPKTETYIHLLDKSRRVYQEFMGKKYLVDDTLSISPWKLGDEKLEILGYTCQMAFMSDSAKQEEITAWFTPEIMPFVGPDRFANLPGTVLAVDINNGERTWIARKIDFRELSKNELKKQSKGEVMSREDYQQMVEEQLEKMRQNRGGMIRFGG